MEYAKERGKDSVCMMWHWIGINLGYSMKYVVYIEGILFYEEGRKGGESIVLCAAERIFWIQYRICSICKVGVGVFYGYSVE